MIAALPPLPHALSRDREHALCLSIDELLDKVTSHDSKLGRQYLLGEAIEDADEVVGDLLILLLVLLVVCFHLILQE